MLMSILLLFVFIQNLNGLICPSPNTYYFSRNEFNWNNFSTILNDITTQTTSNFLTCHVRITVDYNNRYQYVTIKFQPKLNLSNSNIEFGSIINSSQNKLSSIISYLDYQCSSGNVCDKNFLKKWSKQILNSSQNSLHKNFLSLWNNSNICQYEYKTQYCQSYLCFTIYNELKNLSYGKFQCDDLSSTNPVHINIQTNTEKHKNLQYQCRKNQCTGEIFYNLNQQKNSTEISINNYHNKLQLDYKKLCLIIGILIFIGCIAYYFQCRRYNQGYKLTVNA